LEIMLLRDDDPLDGLLQPRAFAPNPAHVSRDLPDYPVGGMSPLELDDDKRVRTRVSREEVKPTNRRRQLMTGLAGLGFPNLERPAQSMRSELDSRMGRR
jgi:hypothetical protein